VREATEKLVRELDTPTGINAFRFVADKNASDSDNWTVPFFTDGTSSGGGAEFTSGDEHFTFLINPNDAIGRVITGPIPDLSQEQWPAGTYAKKTS